MGLGKGAREVPGTSVPRQAGILGEAWGSLQELILKAEGFPQTPPTFFKRCSHPLHPVHPAGKAVLSCHQMPALKLEAGLVPGSLPGRPTLGGRLTAGASQPVRGESACAIRSLPVL